MTRSLLGLLCAAFLMAGCAHQGAKSNVEVSSQDREEDLPAPHPGTVHEVSGFRVNDPEPPAVASEEFEIIPVEVNPKVEQWLHYFQNKGRPYMERYLERSARYSTLMKRILRQNGLPEDLLYIALIESGFSPKITSRAGAVGYWQFIRGTGRRYGLEINPLIDERRDPVLSTQAAADYFKGLYSVFGSWYLAMASYNVGEGRVMREIMRNHTRDFWELARKRRLPRETMSYVPKFIAAKLIAKNPEKYGFTDLDYENPAEFELIRIDKPVNLKTMATKMNIDYDDFKLLNPKFKGEVAPTKQNGILELRVPLKMSEAALVAANASVVDKVEYVADAGETDTYRVRSGDSLYTIARRYRTTVAWLRDFNDIKPGKKLRIGMRIQVPDRSAPKRAVEKPVAVAKKESSLREDREQAAVKTEVETAQGTFYVVQPGDSLSSIAEDYDSTVRELLRMNKLRRGAILRLGMKIKVPKDEGLPQDPGEDNSVKGNVQEQQAKPEREPTDSDSNAKQQPGTSFRKVPTLKWASFPQRLFQQQNQRLAKMRVHVVRPGESLSGISAKYGVPMSRIQARNRLRSSEQVMAGSRLIIPIAKNAETR